MRRRPLLAVGLALTVLAVALLTWVMQRDGETIPVAAPAAPAPTATTAPPVTPSTTTAAPTPSPTVSPRPSATVTPSATMKAPSTEGLRIRIPAIGLDHAMRGEGLSANGTIDPDPGTVMWFTGYDRVRPGKVGTAVVAAHVATGRRADVFADLADLADVDVGDTVEVFEDGKSVTYRVTRARAIDKKKVTTDQTVWAPNSSRTRLAIITCDDAYGLRGDGHRVANFVVIADKV